VDLQETLAFSLYLADRSYDEEVDINREFMERHLLGWEKLKLTVKKQPEHSGDCTKCPWTCMRCLLESFYKQADDLMEVVK